MKKLTLAALAAIMMSGCSTFASDKSEMRDYQVSGYKARGHYVLKMKDVETNETTTKYLLKKCPDRIFSAGTPSRVVALSTSFEKNESGELVKKIDTQQICNQGE